MWAALCAPGPARGEPSATSLALAESLFREAKTLMTQGNAAEACPKFAESNRLDPKLGTLLNLALCHEQEGRMASAWAEFNEVASRAAKAAEAEREKFAREHSAAVEKRISHLTITVAEPTPPSGFDVRLDGEAIGPSLWGFAIPVDPGEHKIEATAPGKERWSRSVAVTKEPSSQKIVVPALTGATSLPPANSASSASVTPGAPPVAPPPPPGGGDSSRRTAGYLVGGVGLAGVVVGSIFGIKTFAKKSDSQSHCNATTRTCDGAGIELQDSARSASTISTIGFGVGLLGLGAGAWLLLSAGPSSTESTGVRLTPMIGSSGASLSASGSW